MPATTQRLTWEAFERLPDDATHKELLEGELLIVPPPRLRHTQAAMRALYRINRYLEGRRLGVVYAEAG